MWENSSLTNLTFPKRDMLSSEVDWGGGGALGMECIYVRRHSNWTKPREQGVTKGCH